jgi:hypothetical protein
MATAMPKPLSAEMGEGHLLFYKEQTELSKEIGAVSDRQK